MFKHYLTTALRYLRSHKLTTGINIACLAIGLVCFLAAHWLALSSLSADRYFPNAERIYVITQASRVPGGVSVENPVTAWIAKQYLQEDFPELEGIARATDGNESGEDEMPVVAGDAKAFVHVRFADPQFLSVFALPFTAGDAKNALRQPRSAVITEQAATQLFGSKERAMGRTLTLHNRYEVTVSGVIAAIKSPSHMASDSRYRFDVLVSMDVYEARAQDNPRRAQALREWQFTDVLTYVVLPKDGSLTPQAFVGRLKNLAEHRVKLPAGMRIEFGATQVSRLNMDIAIDAGGTGVTLLALLYILGGVVLLISCINYANLATAMATARGKEVGLRRVIGASRRQVAIQYLLESGVQSMAALLIAVAVVGIALAVQRIPGTAFILGNALLTPAYWVFMLLLWVAVTFAAGAYPALVLSNIRPLQAVRSGRSKGTRRFLSSLLVGAQFVAASFLLIAVLVMQRQNDALVKSAFSGLEDPVVILRNNIKDANVDFDVLRSELLRQPHIQAVTGSAIAPWSAGISQALIAASADKAARRQAVNSNFVNHDFFDTLHLELLAGRAFDREHAGDRADAGAAIANVVIDSALVAQFGWASAQQAIGKTIYGISNAEISAAPLNVIGVVQTRTLAVSGPTATLYYLNPQRALIPSIRISRRDVPAALAEIDAAWRKLAPNAAMKRQFADQVWEGTYRLVSGLTAGFSAITVLALVNAMLGLVGMSIHALSRRMREIGVRKTLGASVARVLTMLLQDASRPILIGNLIAWPLAYLAMKFYLGLFSYQSAVSIVPYLLSLAATLLIAWTAIAAQATRAARVNPAQVMRYE